MPNPGQKQIPVARVNGIVISQQQVEEGLESVLEPYKDPKGKVRLSQPEQYAARKQVIENLVMRELLYQEGCRRNLDATGEELSRAVSLSAAEFQSPEHFGAMLRLKGLTPEAYREQMRRDIIVNKVAADCVEGKRTPVTARDARKYYDENIHEMNGPEARKVLHIEVPLERYAPAAEEARARKHLEAVQTAAAFEKLVERGGDSKKGIKAESLGFIRRGQFHPLLDSIAFRIKEGEISRIVKTDEGLHRLLVSKVLEAGKVWPFEFIGEELARKIYEMKSVELVNRLVEDLKKKSDVQILDRVADSKLEQEQQ